MRVVVDSLPSEVPHTILQGLLLVLDGHVPFTDVNTVSDHFIVSLMHGESTTPQRPHQAEKETEQRHRPFRFKEMVTRNLSLRGMAI